MSQTTYIGGDTAGGQVADLAVPATVQTDDLMIVASISNQPPTAPAGFSMLFDEPIYGSYHGYVGVMRATATSAGSTVSVTATGGTTTAALVVYRDVAHYDFAMDNPDTPEGVVTPPTVATGDAVATIYLASISNYTTFESGSNLRQSVNNTTVPQGGTRPLAALIADWLPSGTHTRGPGISTRSGFSALASLSLSSNYAPNAPEITTPATGAILDRTRSTRFTAPFSDPNPGDSQSMLDFRYWALDATGARVGAATVVNLQTPYQYWDSPPSTFADTTKYEIQAQSYDALGLESGWGPSTFFTAQTPPPGPTITAPINGASVPQTITVEWSTPNQDFWQVQVLDDAGTVVQDTGEVVGAARSTDVTFAINDATRTIQQRSKYQGLWSPWASVTVTVSYTPPPTPTVTLSPDNAAGATVLAIDNPPPGAGEPSVSYVDVYCRTAAGSALTDTYRPYSEAGVRLATWQPPGSLWNDPIPASTPVVYEYRVVAVGANGTTASSAWVSTATSEPGTARAGTYGGY